MAERYLTRAASLSSGGGGGSTAKVGEWRATGTGLGRGPAQDWLALSEFYSERWTKSARAADALVRLKIQDSLRVRPANARAGNGCGRACFAVSGGEWVIALAWRLSFQDIGASFAPFVPSPSGGKSSGHQRQLGGATRACKLQVLT